MVPAAAVIVKKVLEKPAELAKKVDLSRTRVKYQRLSYEPLAPFAFEITQKPIEVCLPPENSCDNLDAFLEALSTMHDGERSVFLISYGKKFGVFECHPAV